MTAACFSLEYVSAGEVCNRGFMVIYNEIRCM